MYIREIHIENVRGFDEVHLNLDRGGGTYAGWTVIAGPNGTGKSTLLKAVALSVAGPFTASKLERSFAGWVRDGTLRAGIEPRCSGASKHFFKGPGPGSQAALSRAGSYGRCRRPRTEIRGERAKINPGTKPAQRGVDDLSRAVGRQPERLVYRRLWRVSSPRLPRGLRGASNT